MNHVEDWFLYEPLWLKNSHETSPAGPQAVTRRKQASYLWAHLCGAFRLSTRMKSLITISTTNSNYRKRMRYISLRQCVVTRLIALLTSLCNTRTFFSPSSHHSRDFVKEWRRASFFTYLHSFSICRCDTFSSSSHWIRANSERRSSKYVEVFRKVCGRTY